MATRAALVVRGGWDGHVPVAATDRFVPFLTRHGFAVETADSLDVYADPARLTATDLIVQCWSMGTATEEQIAGLVGAVRAGTGFAGWHGGIVDAFRASPAYLQLTGGQFAEHPGGFVDHTYEVVAEHPIVAGLPSSWALHTEQYWMLADGLSDVLAVTRFAPAAGTPWRREVVSPAVWTRRWGAGRVFVSTIGHKLDDLDHPTVRTLTERGLLWAAR